MIAQILDGLTYTAGASLLPDWRSSPLEGYYLDANAAAVALYRTQLDGTDSRAERAQLGSALAQLRAAASALDPAAAEPLAYLAAHNVPPDLRPDTYEPSAIASARTIAHALGIDMDDDIEIILPLAAGAFLAWFVWNAATYAVDRYV